MALLKYTGDIDLSRNGILDILKIQGPNFYEGLSNNLEITTKDETEDESGSSGSLILRSGSSNSNTTVGNVYLFAGSYTDLSKIKGITLTTDEISVSHVKITEQISESLTRKVQPNANLVTYTEEIETAVNGNDKSQLDSKKGFTATSNTLYTLTANNAFTLKAGKGDKGDNYPLEIETSEDDYSKARIKTSTLEAADSVSAPIADIESYVTIGDIRVEYDSSSQSLIFGAV